MAVTRCTCFSYTFKELKTIAAEKGIEKLSQLAQETQCCTGCGSCAPYVQEMLRTGHTVFAVKEGKGRPQPCELIDWESL